jgi:hypothetical protein
MVNAVLVSPQLPTNAGLSRKSDSKLVSAGAGAVSPNFGMHGKAVDTVRPGSEITIDYGDWRFDETETRYEVRAHGNEYAMCDDVRSGLVGTFFFFFETSELVSCCSGWCCCCCCCRKQLLLLLLLLMLDRSAARYRCTLTAIVFCCARGARENAFGGMHENYHRTKRQQQSRLARTARCVLPFPGSLVATERVS